MINRLVSCFVCTAGLGTAAAVLAACGGLQQYAAATQVLPSEEASSGSALLYVSDQYTADVYVYSYPAGRLVATLKESGDPEGLCTDRSGNVFVAVQSGSIVEYAHGGTQPIRTLLDKYYPLACSVDPVTGNLAVANESGNVSVYANGSGHATIYKTGLIPEFSVYDRAGNLFVDSSGAPGVRIEELPKGGSSFQTFTYRGHNNGTPAGLQWVDRQLAVGSASPYQRRCCGRIFRFAVAGEHGRRVATTRIRGEIGNFFVDRSAAIVTTYTDAVVIYDYPSGHRAMTIKEPGAGSFGVVVSR